jgi:hypothetical protein
VALHTSSCRRCDLSLYGGAENLSPVAEAISNRLTAACKPLLEGLELTDKVFCNRINVEFCNGVMYYPVLIIPLISHIFLAIKLLFTCFITALLAYTYYEVLIFSFLEPTFLKIDLIHDRYCSQNSPESDPGGRAV